MLELKLKESESDQQSEIVSPHGRHYSPSLMEQFRSQVPFALDQQALGVEGPEKPVEVFIDVEATRLGIAREINGRVFQGQEETVRALQALPSNTPVSYVVWRGSGQEAKCYFELAHNRLLGVMLMPA